ncbi:MAG TPA: hypothetical protein VNC50_01580 [Planctomycetia bacterium]|nr:hypothetical protein [Planctomycetia bacterium]
MAGTFESGWTHVRYGLGNGLRTLHLVRFSLIFGLAPAVMVLAAAWSPAARSILRNGFVVDGWGQLVHATWLSLLLSAATIVTARVTLQNGLARFKEFGAGIERFDARLRAAGFEPPSGVRSWPWFRWLGLGYFVPVYCWITTTIDPAAWDPGTWWNGAAALLEGTAIAFALLGVATAMQQLFHHSGVPSPGFLPFERLPFFEGLRRMSAPGLGAVGRWLAKPLRGLGPGYFVETEIIDKRTGETRKEMLAGPGHVPSLLFFVLLAALYAAIGLADADIGRPPETYFFPVVGFFLLTAMILLLVGTSLAFFLDYYRVPVLLVLIGASFLLYWTPPRMDHYYDLPPLPQEPATLAAWESVKGQTAFDHWRMRAPGLPPKVARTLVVVTVSGGGIQASAWAAEVLRQLDAEIPYFSKSVGLVSSVSGGSVASMYYLTSRNDFLDPDADPRRLLDAGASDRFWEAASGSSLEPVAWGWAYRDLWRSLIPPVAGFAPEEDRGWAIEKLWRNRLGKGDVHLSDLAVRVKRGGFPIPVFNAVLTETGQRLAISPTTLHDEPPANGMDNWEFRTLYPGSDLRLSTAARLSATFSYISPICRPRGAIPAGREYHVADGGYVDNEGAIAAVEWLQQLLATYALKGDFKDAPFQRILAVRIFPFEIPAQSAPAVADAGWVYGLVGPMLTVLSGRTATQTERAGLEVSLLKAFADAVGPVVEKLEATAEAPATGLEENDAAQRLWPKGRRRTGVNRAKSWQIGSIEFAEASFVYTPETPDETTPLNWKLTRAQKERIGRRWQAIKIDAGREGNALGLVRKFFGVRTP